MTRQPKHKILRMVLVAALIATAIYSYVIFKDSHSEAVIAHEYLARATEATRIIKHHRRKPTIAGLHEKRQLEISRYIESSANIAGIASTSIDSIDPGSIRRLGESPYKEKPTEVHLREVSLKQSITFLHHLATGPAALNVKNIRMVAPRKTESQKLWKAEITLTYIIYAPKGNAHDGTSSQ